MKKVYKNLISKALENGDIEIARHYQMKLLQEQTKQEANVVGIVLLTIFLITLIAPFLMA